MSSIAIPAIGTGAGGIPRPLVAWIMYEGVALFSDSHPATKLKNISFVLHDTDEETITVSVVVLSN